MLSLIFKLLYIGLIYWLLKSLFSGLNLTDTKAEKKDKSPKSVQRFDSRDEDIDDADYEDVSK
ncbi:MAG: hypothetical protein GF398_00720 [Chitinivibrionales bacterium]|nr:hypothetical protein [Chitinivibrionales bacterium]